MSEPSLVKGWAIKVGFKLGFRFRGVHGEGLGLGDSPRLNLQNLEADDPRPEAMEKTLGFLPNVRHHDCLRVAAQGVLQALCCSYMQLATQSLKS